MTDPLPYRPSELLRLALDDLGRVEADARYRVSMGEWHSPRDRRIARDSCAVCLAGAVMAMTLGKQPDQWGAPNDFPMWISNKLTALDFIRRGHLRTGVKVLGLRPPPGLLDRGIRPYGDSPQGFRTDVLAAADALEEAGL